MADITLKLIWYRLGETYSKMAEVSSTWYTELDFDSYVLDLLLLGWCTGACMVVLAVNAIVSALGPVQKQPALERSRELTCDAFASVSASQHETCRWFNTALNWLYLHYHHPSPFLDEWVKSLNEQLTKLGGPVQNRFESIQPGSLPPKIVDISCQAAPLDTFLIHAHLESQDLLLSIFASQQTTEGVRLTNCVAHVLKLKGTLRVKAFPDGKHVKVTTNFEGKPDIKVVVNPTNPYQDPSTLVDMGVVEQNVRNAISLAKTTFTVTEHLMPGDLSTVKSKVPVETEIARRPGEIRVRASDAGWGMSDADIAILNQRFTAQNLQNQMTQLASSIQQPVQAQSAQIIQQVPPQSRPQPVHSVSVQKGPDSFQSISVQPVRSQQLSQHPPNGNNSAQSSAAQMPPLQGSTLVSGKESLFEPISPRQYQSAFTSPSSGPSKPPRMVGDKRLLVKVIKGNALTLPEGRSISAVCYVSTDEPVQSYTSSVVKNTANPFWDEHFLFDITKDTKEVKFEAYDKSRSDGVEEYVGESTVYVEDLRKTPSSRQIMRLQSQPGSFDYSTGTITAEFLFMEPSEADTLLNSMNLNNSQLSPRRRIEVSQTVTPGGTRVTTTTTTTQKPQYGRPESGFSTTPNYIEKHLATEGEASLTSDRNSPNVTADSSHELIVINGVESVAETAIRELTDRSRRPRTPTKTSTLIITGVKRTIESSPTEDPPDSSAPSHSTPERPPAHGLAPETEKKKTSFWKRFGRKKRSQSADRTASSMREGSYLRPPEPQYGPQSKDDLELVRPQEPGSPNLKKSRSLGGSLRKLFKRGRKSRSRAREGEASRESSLSRGSGRNPASRDGSLTRQTGDQRASSVS